MDHITCTTDSILEYGRANLHLGLLENILKRYKTFTRVQREAIPAILEGRDVLLKSQTGSGKTLAFMIPILSNLLQNVGEYGPGDVKALIVVPSAELVNQVLKVCHDLLQTSKCRLTIGDKEKLSNVIVDKPKGAKGIALDNLATIKFLVLDEADLLFEFGFKDATFELARALRNSGRRKTFQSILSSATLTPQVLELAEILLYKPITIDVATSSEPRRIKQFYLKSSGAEREKILYIYTMLKMEVLVPPCIVFCNDDFKSYKLKTVLGKLTIQVPVLSKLLSLKMRESLIQMFNQGTVPLLIISDASVTKEDTEMILSRGIDFKSVACIVNYDEPLDTTSYTHRIGRCGRGGKSGTAITILVESSDLLQQLVDNDNYCLEALELDADLLKPLGYRIDDVLTNVPRQLVDVSRMQALRLSALADEAFIANVNQRDENLLKAVVTNSNEKLKSDKIHLKHLPNYLVTPKLKEGVLRVREKIASSLTGTPGSNSAESVIEALEKKRGKKKPLKSSAAAAGLKVWKQNKAKRRVLPKFKKRKK